MARGGIRDQLAGGYHRYATSRYWIVPHFEKMLYDNAQLASAHLLAFEATGDPRWRHEAEATFAFVARTLTAPEGGFSSALDAETDGEEGAYLRLDPRRGQAACSATAADFDAFTQVYGLKREPELREGPLRPARTADPRRAGRDAQDHARGPGSPARPAPRQAPGRARPPPAPLRDDKVLTAWNGLMIAAYADGLPRPEGRPATARPPRRPPTSSWTKLRTPDGRLLRTYRAGQAKLPAYLEDYAFLAHGLLRLHAATGDPTGSTRPAR